MVEKYEQLIRERIPYNTLKKWFPHSYGHIDSLS